MKINLVIIGVLISLSLNIFAENFTKINKNSIEIIKINDGIRDIICYENNFFVLNLYEKKVFVYDENWNVIKEIGQKGKGPCDLSNPC